jgi:malonate-semialdehyde dehydrogenase (acetylating) / methylmalonate-semialdehyde dehydrogenase
MADAATARKVGFGLDRAVEMGPVIAADSRARIESLIARGASDGAEVLVDGRGAVVEGCGGELRHTPESGSTQSNSWMRA